jgi:addiction module HigA family antidote
VGAEAVAELKSEASFSSSCSNDINRKESATKVVLVGRPTSNWVSHGDYGSVYMTTTIGPIPRHPVGAGFGGRAQLMNCLVVVAPPAATRVAIPCRAFIGKRHGEQDSDERSSRADEHPPHPGSFIRTEILEPLGLSVTAGAQALGVSRVVLSSLLNGQADLSGDMALRIEKASGIRMETLMRMQSSYDIVQTRQREKLITVRQNRKPAA